MGKKKQPTYRIVAADARKARNGKILEIVGTYQPRGVSAAEPETVVNLDAERARAWLDKGAQPTERVAKILRAAGALDASDATPTRPATAPAAPATAPVAVSESPTVSDDAGSGEETAPSSDDVAGEGADEGAS
jgi:small subunit ribosomal protein S16